MLRVLRRPEASGVSAVKQNPIATQKKTAKENTAPVEKRLTRAMTAAKGTGQQKKSPTKKTVAIKVNEPSTSKANASSRKPRERPESNTSKLRRSSRKTRVAFEEDHDTNEMKTPEKRRIKQKIVPTPAVLRDSNKEPSTSKLRISSRKTRVAIFVDDHDNEEIKTPQVSRSMKNRVRTPAVKSNEDEEALEAMETDSNECAVNSTKGAQEFYGNLERESDLLLKCCDRWSKPAFTELVPQEVSDEIDSTVGQARLLVSDKFQQFKHLIQRFEEGSQPPVTAQDLHGFWDMIYIQVDKMKERFDQLTELKNCNWQKKTEQVVAKKRVASKPKAVKPVVKSRFQEFMAKKKMKNTKKSCDSQNVTPNKESQSNTGNSLILFIIL
ncbi:disks large-associated protein 5-like [Nilaparvata lugens]|uniref:disks large-associated protein 5-like n=1 Tax=Nilaparvata lugens TaxID=108931 RepID=UPI00193DFBB1|nr:disks large-associated protein 5-like [Nilaparvata lugens]